MNLGPRVTSKGMWWDGQYGGVIKNGQFAMLYRRPNLENIGVFDSIICFPAASTDKAYNHVVHNGVKHDLSNDEINYVDSQIDRLFPDAGGGGGGGGDPMAIVSIDGSSADPYIVVRRSDGTFAQVNLANTIQNTPAYELLVNSQGKNNNPMFNMVKGDGDKNGVKCKGLNVKMSVPTWMYNLGGGKLGGDYDPATGDIFIAADSVDGTWMFAWHIGVHPDWPKYAQGKPQGNYSVKVHIERKNADGTYTEIASKEYNHGTMTGTYPNNVHLNFNTTSFQIPVSNMNSGWYRYRFSVTSYGNDPSVYPWIRLMAVADGWMSNNSSNFYFQVKGSIKATAGAEAIPPVPRP